MIYMSNKIIKKWKLYIIFLWLKTKEKELQVFIIHQRESLSWCRQIYFSARASCTSAQFPISLFPLYRTLLVERTASCLTGALKQSESLQEDTEFSAS